MGLVTEPIGKINYEPAAAQGEFRTAAPEVVTYLRAWEGTRKPLLGRLVDQICASDDIPLDLATILEDIGQFHIRLADDIMAERLRRGLIEPEQPEELD